MKLGKGVNELKAHALMLNALITMNVALISFIQTILPRRQRQTFVH